MSEDKKRKLVEGLIAQALSEVLGGRKVKAEVIEVPKGSTIEAEMEKRGNVWCEACQAFHPKEDIPAGDEFLGRQQTMLEDIDRRVAHMKEAMVLMDKFRGLVAMKLEDRTPQIQLHEIALMHRLEKLLSKIVE